MAIIVSKNGKDARRIEKTRFDRESSLQLYLSDNPAAIPLEDMDGQNPFVLVREFPVESGNIDILCTDASGRLYIVETKLYRNPDKRKVLAQVLDYGAAVWRLGSSDFMDALEERYESSHGRDLASALRDSLMDPVLVMDNIGVSIRNSDIRFVILMDQVPNELKDLVLFMNQNSKFSIYLVELEYYRLDHNEVIVPHVFGNEIVKDLSTTRSRFNWNQESFMEDFKKRNGNAETDAAEAIIAWFTPRVTDIYWGEGTTAGAFVPVLVSKGVRYQLFVMRSDGRIQMNFQHYGKKPQLDSREIRRELMQRLNRIKGVNIDEASLDRRPSIRVTNLAEGDGLKEFISAYEWMISLVTHED
jgi:hypothetical protein